MKSLGMILSCYASALFLTTSVTSETALANSSESACQEPLKSFLQEPTENGVAALRAADKASCWREIQSSNAKLIKLQQNVQAGNKWAAHVLAAHLHTLGGGNLEDSLVALGTFSESQPDEMLRMAKDKALTKHQFTDALTMLPLSMSDDFRAQLETMKARRVGLERSSEEGTREQKKIGLEAINDFIKEIERAKAGS